MLKGRGGGKGFGRGGGITLVLQGRRRRWGRRGERWWSGL